MLYLTTALYCEAKPFITYFQLRKSERFHRFQVFTGNNMVLIITGTGELESSVAVASVCSTYVPMEGDIFLSFGSGKALSEHMPIGEICLLNRITQVVTDKTFYPEIMLNHPFHEAQCISGIRSMPVNSVDWHRYLHVEAGLLPLFDMASSASYMSASYFFDLHHMVFLRLVSGCLSEDIDSGADVSEEHATSIITLIERKWEKLTPFLEKLIASPKADFFSHDMGGDTFLAQVSKILNLSVSMKNTLSCYLDYYLSVHDNLAPILNWCNTHLPTQCKCEKDGKIYFEKLKKLLI